MTTNATMNCESNTRERDGALPLNMTDSAPIDDRAPRTPLDTDALITSHLGLVVAIAKRYSERGVGLSDLIAEGNAGLVRAAARFDPSRGVRFSSYAYPWIEHAIRAACMQYRDVITIPSAMKRLIYAYRRLHASREPGQELTSAEVAAELGVPREEAVTIMAAAAGARSTGSSSDTYDAMKFVAAPERRAQSDSLESRDIIAAVSSAVEHLNPMEQQVVSMHFGLGGRLPCTRAAIASELEVLPECVEWTLNRALSKLRVVLARQRVA